MKNNNYPSWLVPIEIVNELKETGFNCFEMVIDTQTGEWYKKKEVEEAVLKHSNLEETCDWEQVLEWFRDKKCIGIVTYRYKSKTDKGFSYEIIGLRKLFALYNTYEEAREALIRELINVFNLDLKKAMTAFYKMKWSERGEDTE